MSQGLQALDNADYETARSAFERAQKLRPDLPVASEGLARVTQAVLGMAVEKHQAQATKYVDTENWQAAAEEYGKILKLDANIKLAQLGQARCQQRADLVREIRGHIDNPDRFSSDAVLGEAQTLLDKARTLEAPGAKHSRLCDDLERLLAKARVLVPVHLLSDEQTQITVYRVGRLGSFKSLELSLRPGSYTVVGSREGYRDVRRELKVESSTQPDPLVVRCEERI